MPSHGLPVHVHMPALSIVIPTFNSGQTMVRCLESIHRQTFSDYEVLIQDGGSTDNTLALISEFAAAHINMTIRVCQEADRGVYDAMNKAMSRATGEWLYFLGGDDALCDKDGFAKMLHSPAAREADVLYGGVKVARSGQAVSNAPIYGGRFTTRRIFHQNICHQAILYRHSFVQAVGGYNTRYRILADWDYNLRCWSRTRPQHVDVILAVFHLGGLSSTGRDTEFLGDVAQNVMRYFGWSSLHPLLNSRSFIGSHDIAEIQRRCSPLHYAAGCTLRLMMRVANRIQGTGRYQTFGDIPCG